jgi:hypothetical protein
VDECGLKVSGVGNSKRLAGLKEFLFPEYSLYEQECEMADKQLS